MKWFNVTGCDVNSRVEWRRQYVITPDERLCLAHEVFWLGAWQDPFELLRGVIVG